MIRFLMAGQTRVNDDEYLRFVTGRRFVVTARYARARTARILTHEVCRPICRPRGSPPGRPAPFVPALPDAVACGDSCR